MTSSSYPSESLLLRQLQPTLGDVVWRPKMFRKMPKPPGDWLDGLTAPVVDVLRQILATRWLAAKPDLKTMKRDDYKLECIQKFRISGRTFQFLVWRDARRWMGLTECASPGPKKQIKK